MIFSPRNFRIQESGNAQLVRRNIVKVGCDIRLEQTVLTNDVVLLKRTMYKYALINAISEFTLKSHNFYLHGEILKYLLSAAVAKYQMVVDYK